MALNWGLTEMADLTFRGKLDRVYMPDDRDPIVKGLPEKDRLPKYGTNSLRKPKRAFSGEVAKAADKIGMPKQPHKQ